MVASRFSASNVARFMACPGSANLEASIPGWIPPVVDDKVGARGKGSEIHKIFEAVTSFSTKDMLAIATAIQYVAELRKRRRFKVLTEHTMVAEWLPSKPSTTVDLILYTQDELHIVDYKTGVIPVNALDNKQLMFYAATAAPFAPKATEVHLHIVQPWASSGCHEWVCSAQELAVFMNEAEVADQKILDGVTDRVPSDNCTFCAANPHSRSPKGSPLCPEMLNLLYPMPFNEAEILA